MSIRSVARYQRDDEKECRICTLVLRHFPTALKNRKANRVCVRDAAGKFRPLPNPNNRLPVYRLMLCSAWLQAVSPLLPVLHIYRAYHRNAMSLAAAGERRFPIPRDRVKDAREV